MATDKRTRVIAFASYVGSGEWMQVGTVALTAALFWVIYINSRGPGSGRVFAHLHRRPAANDDNQTSLLVGAVFTDLHESGFTFEAYEYDTDDDDHGFGRAGAVARKFVACDVGLPLDTFTSFLVECGPAVEAEYEARGNGEPIGLCENECCGEPYLKAGEVLGSDGKSGYCSDDCGREGDEAAGIAWDYEAQL